MAGLIGKEVHVVKISGRSNAAVRVHARLSSRLEAALADRDTGRRDLERCLQRRPAITDVLMAHIRPRLD